MADPTKRNILALLSLTFLVFGSVLSIEASEVDSNILADGGNIDSSMKESADVPRHARVPVSTVAFFTFLMASATGLGAVPFFFLNLEPAWQGICNGIACGVMLAASFDLIVEGQSYGGGGCVVLGILIGGVFIYGCQKLLESFGDVKMIDLKKAGVRRMVLIVAIMTLHSFGEGSGVGVSFAGPKGYSQGLLVTIAIAVHNIPEGLAVSMVMAARGVSAKNAMLWSIFTSLPQPLVAVPAYLSADLFKQFLPLCVGFAAGCMIWMVFGEVMPESFKDSEPSHVASAATISVAMLEGVGTMLEGVDSLPGWEQVGPMVYSLLFVLGPFLGGFMIVALKQSIPLHSTLLAGLSAGAMITLGLWRPGQLWLSGKMSFLMVAGLLYTGSFIYLSLASLLKRTSSSKRCTTAAAMDVKLGETDADKPAFPVSRVGRSAMLACSAVVCHALIEGLMLGVAAPHAEGLGIYMLLPVALHGLPRGIAVACAMYGISKDSSTALLVAALTGLAGPIGAWGALLAGLDYRGLDYWMVIACGSLIPAATSDLLPRSIGLDRQKTLVGLGTGATVVLFGLWGTRLMCLNTPYCNAAPEAVS